MRSATLLFVLVVATACETSHGFDRGAMSEQVSGAAVVTEGEIAKVLTTRPQLPSPFRLAVHFVPPTAAESRYGRPDFVWREEDRRRILAALAARREAGVIAEVLVLDTGIVEGEDRRAIRLGAARTGADAVLVVRGAMALDEYNNALGLTYLLIVTTLFSPASVTDGLFLSSAQMWDVRNDYLYLSAEAEGTATQTRPLAFKNVRLVVDEAKGRSLAALADEVADRIR